jgi:hypothetical protein
MPKHKARLWYDRNTETFYFSAKSLELDREGVLRLIAEASDSLAADAHGETRPLAA